MKQETFTDIEYSFRKKKTKREEFLEIMDEIIPWDEWVGVIKPYYPKGKRGRPPMGIEKMLRMYLLQIWFNLSDPATEDAIYDSYAMRKFTGIDFMTEAVPDETTLCNFRHLLEANGLNKLFFDAINRVMVQTGHMMKGGTIVDATIINAPSSTKNADKARDPEMHQTKKGNEWKFGMKCHIGVDAGSGLVHTITVTAANEHDITQAAALIREDDEVVYGDSGYIGIQKRPEVTSDAHLSGIDYHLSDGKRLINARSETASQKAMFADGIRQRRCLIPAQHYYEWETADGRKVKYTIEPEGSEGFFLAGIYRMEAGKPVFTILTRNAAEGIDFIHERMPVILPNEAVEDWLNPKYHGDDILQVALLNMKYKAC